MSESPYVSITFRNPPQPKDLMAEFAQQVYEHLVAVDESEQLNTIAKIAIALKAPVTIRVGAKNCGYSND